MISQVSISLLLLFIISTIIWFIFYAIIYPKKVGKDIKKLTLFDIFVSIFSLIVLYITYLLFLEDKLLVTTTKIHPLLICLLISIISETPFFFWYKHKNNIKYSNVIEYQTGAKNWKELFTFMIFSILLGAIIGLTENIILNLKHLFFNN